MIGSPRYLAMQAAMEANAVRPQKRNNRVQLEAVRELASRPEAVESLAKLTELATLCSRCRAEQCVALWDEFRVCETCLQILTDKYDRKPVEPSGTYTEGFHAGRRHAFGEAAEWVSQAIRINRESPF